MTDSGHPPDDKEAVMARLAEKIGDEETLDILLSVATKVKERRDAGGRVSDVVVRKNPHISSTDAKLRGAMKSVLSERRVLAKYEQRLANLQTLRDNYEQNLRRAEAGYRKVVEEYFGGHDPYPEEDYGNVSGEGEG